MESNNFKDDNVWIDFECELPQPGQKIKILRQIEIETVWGDHPASKFNADQKFIWAEKTYWKACE